MVQKQGNTLGVMHRIFKSVVGVGKNLNFYTFYPVVFHSFSLAFILTYNRNQAVN